MNIQGVFDAFLPKNGIQQSVYREHRIPAPGMFLKDISETPNNVIRPILDMGMNIFDAPALGKGYRRPKLPIG